MSGRITLLVGESVCGEGLLSLSLIQHDFRQASTSLGLGSYTLRSD